MTWWDRVERLLIGVFGACALAVGVFQVGGRYIDHRLAFPFGDEVVVYHANIYRQWGHLGQLDAYLKDGDLLDPNWRRWGRDE